jgi:glycosyltransferase involved in cell wall biosynthesis
MTNPNLTVIVPTRERADTLRHTLRTLVSQDFQDCEFVVSDNFSQDETRAVVESFTDPRIRYINTGKRLSMSQNWEFALEQSRGDYVTYIGDDDGFIPGALTAAMQVLHEAEHEAIVWEKAEYCWPDYIADAMKNWLSVRLANFRLNTANGDAERQRVLDFRSGYTRLPCLYNGIVNKRFLTDLKQKSVNGVFFNAVSPDAFSALAISMVVGTYLVTNYPFSINGASRHSNGTSFMRRGTDGKDDNPTTKFYSENQLTYDPRIALAPSIPVVIMGEILLIKKYLPDLGLTEPAWTQYVEHLVKDARGSSRPAEVLKSARHTATQLGLGIKIPEAGRSREAEKAPRTVLDRDVLRFRPHGELVENIYDACLLVSSMVPDARSIAFGGRLGARRSWIRRIFGRSG